MCLVRWPGGAGGFRTLARDRRTLGGVPEVEFLRMSALVFGRTSAGFRKTLPEFVDGKGSKSSVGGSKIEPRRAKLRPRAPKLSPRRIQRRFFAIFQRFEVIFCGFEISAASLEGQNEPKRSPRAPQEAPKTAQEGLRASTGALPRHPVEAKRRPRAML